MATVITNLLSAIPVFGHDLVELILSTNFFFSTALSLKFKIFTVYSPDLEVNNVFILTIGVLNSVLLPILPTIGTLNPHAYKKDIKKKINKSEYLTIPPQFLSYLVGLIDGDGYLGVNSSATGNIGINLTIQLHLDDLSTLEYIHSVLKLGRIKIYKDQRSPNARFILNKTELQDVFFPLLIFHNIFFLTENRRSQFNRAMFIFEKNIKNFDQVPNYVETPSFSILPVNSLGYLNLPFFKNWVVGFTNAEGSFLVKANKDACFQLKQAIHLNMFDSFKVLFDTSRKLSMENGKFLQFSVSSKKDIQTVINFFSFSGLHPLTGLKTIQYINWLNKLKLSDRYKNLNFPI